MSYPVHRKAVETIGSWLLSQGFVASERESQRLGGVLIAALRDSGLSVDFPKTKPDSPAPPPAPIDLGRQANNLARSVVTVAMKVTAFEQSRGRGDEGQKVQELNQVTQQLADDFYGILKELRGAR